MLNARPSSHSLLFADTTRIFNRHIGKVLHSGIDRVNLEYARWVLMSGGHLSLRLGNRAFALNSRRWPELLTGKIHAGDEENTVARRIFLAGLALATVRPLPRGATMLVSSHSWLASEKVWQALATRGVKSVVFIHDLIPIQFPEYSRAGEKPLHVRRISLTLRNAQGILVNSECTKDALISHAEDIGSDVPPIRVAPLGYEIPSISEAELPARLKRPFFLVLGTIEPRKNHLLLLSLWRELVKSGKNPPTLVIVGRRGWECEQVVDFLERCDSLREHVMEINDAQDPLVRTLLKTARALLMPSFAEGFGMPVQEALASGTPVICSRLRAIQEFAGHIPDYADPLDGERWKQLVLDYSTEDSPLRQSQLDRLKNFRKTSWEEHFSSVADFLETLS